MALEVAHFGVIPGSGRGGRRFAGVSSGFDESLQRLVAPLTTHHPRPGTSLEDDVAYAFRPAGPGRLAFARTVGAKDDFGRSGGAFTQIVVVPARVVRQHGFAQTEASIPWVTEIAKGSLPPVDLAPTPEHAEIGAPWMESSRPSDCMAAFVAAVRDVTRRGRRVAVVGGVQDVRAWGSLVDAVLPWDAASALTRHTSEADGFQVVGLPPGAQRGRGGPAVINMTDPAEALDPGAQTCGRFLTANGRAAVADLSNVMRSLSPNADPDDALLAALLACGAFSDEDLGQPALRASLPRLFNMFAQNQSIGAPVQTSVTGIAQGLVDQLDGRALQQLSDLARASPVPQWGDLEQMLSRKRYERRVGANGDWRAALEGVPSRQLASAFEDLLREARFDNDNVLEIPAFRRWVVDAILHEGTLEDVLRISTTYPAEGGRGVAHLLVVEIESQLRRGAIAIRRAVDIFDRVRSRRETARVLADAPLSARLLTAAHELPTREMGDSCFCALIAARTAPTPQLLWTWVERDLPPVDAPTDFVIELITELGGNAAAVRNMPGASRYPSWVAGLAHLADRADQRFEPMQPMDVVLARYLRTACTEGLLRADEGRAVRAVIALQAGTGRKIADALAHYPTIDAALVADTFMLYLVWKAADGREQSAFRGATTNLVRRLRDPAAVAVELSRRDRADGTLRIRSAVRRLATGTPSLSESWGTFVNESLPSPEGQRL